ncbi:MAG TPA: pilus assembly protein FimT, partial [Noviherbaspirillum sp.]
DGNTNLRPDASEPVIFSHGPVTNRLSITSNFTDDSSTYLAYAATGRTRTNRNGQQPQAGTVTLKLGKQVRKIKINFLGRARTCNPSEEPQTC